jgi:hypothetical protein
MGTQRVEGAMPTQHKPNRLDQSGNKHQSRDWWEEVKDITNNFIIIPSNLQT